VKKGSKMTKAQRLEHSKRIKRGWAKRKAAAKPLVAQEYKYAQVAIDPIDPWPAGTNFAIGPRERLASLIRQEVARALDELLS
jgi:hypothetical protein